MSQSNIVKMPCDLCGEVDVFPHFSDMRVCVEPDIIHFNQELRLATAKATAICPQCGGTICRMYHRYLSDATIIKLLLED